MEHAPERTEPRFLVLTGGPRAGKTTLLGALRALGHAVVEEAALSVIRSDPSGRLRSDPLELQRRILRLQLEREMTAARSASGLVFVDRGIGDHFAYLRLRGIPLFPELETSWELARTRYGIVFLLEQGPDYAPGPDRDETLEEAAALHEAIGVEYRRRHSRVVDVPWEPLERRVERVLEAAQREIAPSSGAIAFPPRSGPAL